MTQTIPTTVDVLIVGYGPVGAAFAALLGRDGIRTLVIDKSPDVLMAPRAIALDHEALRILQMTGMPDDAFEKIAIPFVRMHSPVAGEFARINTMGNIDGHSKLVTFYQPDLEKALRKRVSECASVTAITDVEMTSYVDHGDSVEAFLKRSDGSETKISSRYLVAADGAGSTVRKSIGQDFGGKTYAEDWLIIDAVNVPGSFDHVEFICDPKRPTPHMLAPGGRIRWEFMLHKNETREQMEKDETIKKLLARWGSSDQMRIERKAVYRFHARSCNAYSKGRVFLVGDAAHITPPFVGQGLVAGLRDAANLSWKLAAVVHRQASPSILGSYDVERRPHATKMIALAKFMGQLVMPRNSFTALLIHGTLSLFRRIPGLREFLEENDIKPKHEFKDGLFIKGRGRLKRGGMIAQGLVRSTDGSIFLSDDALGQQLALVGFGLDATASLSSETRRRWSDRGAKIVHFCQHSSSAHRTDRSFEDLTNTLIPTGKQYGWCAVVRPDRTIINEGPVEHADFLVNQAIQLLDAPTL